MKRFEISFFDTKQGILRKVEFDEPDIVVIHTESACMITLSKDGSINTLSLVEEAKRVQEIKFYKDTLLKD